MKPNGTIETREEAIELMLTSKNIDQWNENRDKVLYDLNIKIRTGLRSFIMNTESEHFDWFMQSINCSGLISKVLNKTLPKDPDEYEKYYQYLLTGVAVVEKC